MTNKEEFIDFLNFLMEDEEISKKIRAKINDLISLSDKEDLGIFLDKSTNIFEDILENPDIPMYTRTQLWEGLSLIESVQL